MPKYDIIQAWIFITVNFVMFGNSSHLTITLSNHLSGSVHSYTIEGATIMTEKYYKDKNLLKTITIVPKLRNANLLIKIVYVDIKKQSPCQDHLSICELEMGRFPYTCTRTILNEFCGDMNDLNSVISSKPSSKVFITKKIGQGVLIKWRTLLPESVHEGFKMQITAIIPQRLCQSNPNLFHCLDGHCIGKDLHCDGINHCIDASDEVIDCSNSNVTLISDCNIWGEDYCNNGLWPKIGLCFLIFLFVSIATAFFIFNYKRLKKLLLTEGKLYCLSKYHEQESPSSQNLSHPHIAVEPSAPPGDQIMYYFIDPDMIRPPPYNESITQNIYGIPPPSFTDLDGQKTQCNEEKSNNPLLIAAGQGAPDVQG